MHHETILIVDDEPTVRMFVVDQLRSRVRGLGSQDGAAALRILNSSVKIDLLISDVGRPAVSTDGSWRDAARGLRPNLKILL